uniref:Uncharacterized protein n=1 Tax=Phaeomonas parva TaxID=124430 RepID=A0A7S1XZ31_9STRA|mmetsp:Transcript_46295/g.144815  ORF Transcript_46295/g.144815 Transcript_46295/m.144815 type:complete len:984 (+) Transcript_46295:115-3066(+)
MAERSPTVPPEEQPGVPPAEQPDDAAAEEPRQLEGPGEGAKVMDSVLSMQAAAFEGLMGMMMRKVEESQKELAHNFMLQMEERDRLVQEAIAQQLEERDRQLEEKLNHIEARAAGAASGALSGNNWDAIKEDLFEAVYGDLPSQLEGTVVEAMNGLNGRVVELEARMIDQIAVEKQELAHADRRGSDVLQARYPTFQQIPAPKALIESMLFQLGAPSDASTAATSTSVDTETEVDDGPSGDVAATPPEDPGSADSKEEEPPASAVEGEAQTEAADEKDDEDTAPVSEAIAPKRTSSTSSLTAHAIRNSIMKGSDRPGSQHEQHSLLSELPMFSELHQARRTSQLGKALGNTDAMVAARVTRLEAFLKVSECQEEFSSNQETLTPSKPAADGDSYEKEEQESKVTLLDILQSRADVLKERDAELQANALSLPKDLDALVDAILDRQEFTRIEEKISFVSDTFDIHEQRLSSLGDLVQTVSQRDEESSAALEKCVEDLNKRVWEQHENAQEAAVKLAELEAEREASTLARHGSSSSNNAEGTALERSLGQAGAYASEVMSTIMMVRSDRTTSQILKKEKHLGSALENMDNEIQRFLEACPASKISEICEVIALPDGPVRKSDTELAQTVAAAVTGILDVSRALLSIIQSLAEARDMGLLETQAKPLLTKLGYHLYVIKGNLMPLGLLWYDFEQNVAKQKDTLAERVGSLMKVSEDLAGMRLEQHATRATLSEFKESVEDMIAEVKTGDSTTVVIDGLETRMKGVLAKVAAIREELTSKVSNDDVESSLSSLEGYLKRSIAENPELDRLKMQLRRKADKQHLYNLQNELSSKDQAMNSLLTDQSPMLMAQKCLSCNRPFAKGQPVGHNNITGTGGVSWHPPNTDGITREVLNTDVPISETKRRGDLNAKVTPSRMMAGGPLPNIRDSGAPRQMRQQIMDPRALFTGDTNAAGADAGWVVSKHPRFMPPIKGGHLQTNPNGAKGAPL